MSLPTSEATLAAAEWVAQVLVEHGIDSALTDGMALSVYGFVRATRDVDLATGVHAFKDLPRVETALRAEGFRTDLVEPDARDPLGGVLNLTRDDIDLIQIVNFLNPLGGGHGTMGKEVVETAAPLEGSSLEVVDLPHLILLKLYSGGSRSLQDVLELPDRNIGLDLRAVETLCRRFKPSGAWKRVLASRSP